jgi:protein-disulfide isomerase
MRQAPLWLLLPLLAACGKPATPAPEVQSAASVATVSSPSDVSSSPDVSPPPVDTAPPRPTPPPEPVSSPAEPDDRILEKTPGLTPPLELVRVPPTKAAKGLAGTPQESAAAGPDDAIVKVFVFSDFQCPVCRRAVEPLKKLVRAYPKELQLIFKHHALSSHGRAEPAARAALAAQKQGRFWEFHDRTFDAQQNLEDADLLAHATAVGCDPKAFELAFQDPALAAQVAYESAQAQALGMEGTPAFVINGEKSVGWGSYLGIESQVKVALETARALAASGTPKARVALEATRAKDPAAASILFGD